MNEAGVIGAAIITTALVAAVALATTPSAKYADDMSKAMASKPADFVGIDGNIIAVVSADGRCAITGGIITVAEAQQLSAWITTNFGALAK